MNGLTQGTIEGIWHTTLDDHPDRCVGNSRGAAGVSADC